MPASQVLFIPHQQRLSAAVQEESIQDTRISTILHQVLTDIVYLSYSYIHNDSNQTILPNLERGASQRRCSSRSRFSPSPPTVSTCRNASGFLSSSRNRRPSTTLRYALFCTLSGSKNVSTSASSPASASGCTASSGPSGRANVLPSCTGVPSSSCTFTAKCSSSSPTVDATRRKLARPASSKFRRRQLFVPSRSHGNPYRLGRPYEIRCADIIAAV